MSTAELKHYIRQMEAFFATPFGQHLARAELREISRISQQLSYDYATLLSSVEIDLSSDKIIYLKPLNAANNTDLVVEDFSHLPLLPASQHLLICHHLPEFFSTNAELHAWLCAVNELLAPGAKLLVIYFNWFNIWRFACPFALEKIAMPKLHYHWQLTMIHSYRRAGLKLKQTKNLFYRPPSQDRHLLEKYSWLDPFGNLLVSNMGWSTIQWLEKPSLALKIKKQPMLGQKKYLRYPGAVAENRYKFE